MSDKKWNEKQGVMALPPLKLVCNDNTSLKKEWKNPGQTTTVKTNLELEDFIRRLITHLEEA